MSDPITNDLPLIFVHIRKTAGTTLHNILLAQYGRDRVVRIQNHRDETIAQLRSMLEGERSRIRVFSGHQPYGLHEILHSEARYITVLREPVDRIVSLYWYVKSNPWIPPAHELISQDWTLEEFVERSSWRRGFHNGQTSFLGGWLRPGDPVTEETLGAAKQNLETFVTAGLQERFDETLLLMRRAFRWDWPLYRRKLKVSVERPRAADLSPKTRERIEELNALDVDLYTYAQQRFDERLELVRESYPEFDRDLRVYRQLNAQVSKRAGRLMTPAMWRRRLRRVARTLRWGGQHRIVGESG